MTIRRIHPSSIAAPNVTDGSILLYNAANSVVEFGTAPSSGGVSVYATVDDLPSSGTIGAQAYVTSTTRLYLWSGAGWYNIALINQTPAIQSILDGNGESSPFALSLEGATTTITMIAADPEGTPVTYSAVADSDFNAMATVSQLSNVFTITPTAIEGANTGTITFKASDGINLASEISTFTLSFAILDPDFNSVSFLSHFNGADNGVNNTFIDGSTSAHAITANGNVTQGSFGPFARPDGEWAVDFNGTSDYLNAATSAGFAFGTGDYTIETFVFCTNSNGTNKTIWSNHWSGTGQLLMTYDHPNSGAKKFGFFDAAYNAGTPILISAVFEPNQWVHVAIVRSSGVVKMYINGDVQATATQTTNLTKDIFCLGSVYSTSAVQPWAGYISNARIVKGTAVYTSAFTPPTEALTAITGTTLLTCQNNRFIDNSVSAHAITVSGNTSVTPSSPFATAEVYDPAVNGASGYFDGTGDYLTTATDAAFAFGTGDFTLECWFNVNQLGVSQKLITFYPVGSLSGYNAIFINTNNTVSYGRNGANNIASSETITTNVWYHLAAVRQSGTTKLYLNGVQVGSNFTDSTSYLTARPAIGTDGYSLNTNNLFGYMSDIRIVKGTAVYTSAFTPPTEPLTAITNTTLLLNMNNGKAIDGTAKNNLTLADDVKLSTAKAKFGNTSMLFDGSGKAYIEGSNVVDFGSGDFTVEFFMNSSTGGGEEVIFDARNPSQGAYFALELDTSNRLNYLVLSATRITSSALSTNTWYHVAVCRSGTSTKMFINGTQAGSTYSDSTVYLSTNRVVLGGYSGSASYDFDGYLDEIRVSKTARYTSNFTPPTEPFPDLG